MTKEKLCRVHGPASGAQAGSALRGISLDFLSPPGEESPAKPLCLKPYAALKFAWQLVA